MKHKDKEIRAKYLKFANVLADIDRTTSERLPITYEHVCELESLLYAIKYDYGFEYKKKCNYGDLVFKEDNLNDK